MDALSITAFGILILGIVITNWVWINKTIAPFIKKPEDMTNLLGSLPLETILKIQKLVLFSFPLFFIAIFLIIFGTNL